MKHIKTFEILSINLPNSSNNLYWTYINSFDVPNHIITTVLKFKEKENLKNGNDIYTFYGINLTNYKYYKEKHKIGDKTNNFEFQKSGIEFAIKSKILRLATVEEINLYLLYTEQEKYNL